MTRFLSNRDGGKTDEKGHLRFLQSLTTGDIFSGGAVSQNSTPNMTVNVAVIDALIRDPANGYAYHGWSDASENVQVTTANASNARKDYLIAYVDRAVTPSTANANNAGIMKFITVAGTPAGSPVYPTVSQIQASAVGTNPYIVIAGINVAAATTTTITDAAIVDLRSFVVPVIPDLSIAGTKHANASITPAKLTNPYKFSAYCSSGKAITNTSLIVDLQTELFDPNNNFASSRYTAPVTGYYQINAQAWCGAAGAGDAEFCNIQIRKNGASILESERVNGSNNANRLMRPKVSALVFLTAGDYIEMWAQFTGSRDIVSGQVYTFMNGFLQSV